MKQMRELFYFIFSYLLDGGLQDAGAEDPE